MRSRSSSQTVRRAPWRRGRVLVGEDANRLALRDCGPDNTEGRAVLSGGQRSGVAVREHGPAVAEKGPAVMPDGPVRCYVLLLDGLSFIKERYSDGPQALGPILLVGRPHSLEGPK